MVMWGDKNSRKKDNSRLIDAACLLIGLVVFVWFCYQLGASI